MLKTYRGVFLDINKSDLCVLKYGVFFYFCSESVRDKFDKKVEEYINERLTRMKNILPNTELHEFQLPIAIDYYKQIEKRGYRVETSRGIKIKRGHFLGDIEFEEVKGE